MFSGMISALVTPFYGEERGYEIDWKSFNNLLEWQLSSGVNGFVLYGTTGESPTLTYDEKIEITKRTIDIVKGRVPIIVGAGSNNTKSSIEFINAINKFKLDGALVVAPYYNKPTQEGLFQHFKAIASQGKLPVVLYNVPGRTSVEISIDTISRLSELQGIVSIKQATDSVQNITELCERVGDKISVLAGDDPLTAYSMMLGGKGVISASGSVIPEEMVNIVSAAQSKNYEKACELQKKYLEKIKAIFIETNPVPAKAILKLKGIIENDSPRLPLVRISDQSFSKIKNLFC